MEVLFVDDTFGAKVDAGTDVQVNASGVRVIIATGLPDSSIASANIGLTTTAAAVLTGVTAEFLQLSHVNVLNTGASTRTVTLYLERADATPDYAATDVWCVLTLLANERAEWTPSGWIQFDSAGRELGLPLAATQAEQETATSLVKFVAPGTQHFHPSAAKCWGKVGPATQVPATYNVTSVADTAAGRCTVTIATDFSSADWACVTGNIGVSSLTGATLAWAVAPAAGSVELNNIDATATQVIEDPLQYGFAGYGDIA